MIDPITHFNYLMHEREIEERRRMFEEQARETDPTAIGVMVLDAMPYDDWPGVKKAKAEGYHLTDSFAFGWGEDFTGEILIFSKKH